MKWWIMVGVWCLATLSPFFVYAAEKPKVVASFSIIGDMVSEIAGDNVELTVLVGANGDAHEYQPTAADAKKLAAADVVFINGLGFEGWLSRLAKSSGFKGKLVVVSEGVVPLMLLENDHKAQDPHAWQDVENGKIYVQNIARALADIDKANAKKYQANANIYLKKLDELNTWIKAEFSSIPKEKRRVISTHDAFGYFARAYGVEFVSLLGVNTESEASAADMARIINQARVQKITALFLENMTDSRLIKQLEKDSGAHIGGTLYSDALSAKNEPAATYITMFRHNVGELIKSMKDN